jgi:hypothetical protein
MTHCQNFHAMLIAQLFVGIKKALPVLIAFSQFN